MSAAVTLSALARADLSTAQRDLYRARGILRVLNEADALKLADGPEAAIDAALALVDGAAVRLDALSLKIGGAA